MKHQATTLKTAALLCGLSSLALAGEPVAQAPAEPSAAPFDFCSWLSSKPGTIYKDSTNPWISEIQFNGRFHYNLGYIDGEDFDGRSFSQGYDEYRRARIGAKISFLKYFGFKGSLDLVEDDRKTVGEELDWGYQQWDEAMFSFNAKEAFGLPIDKLSLNYGRLKWLGGLEARTSSNDLLTVERSALANKLYQSARPTAFTVTGTEGPLSFAAGIASTDGDLSNPSKNVEGFGGWNDGLQYFAQTIYQANDDLRFGWEFLYNDANKLSGEDSLLEYKWGTTFSTEYTIGAGGMNLEGFYGDNGDADNGVATRRRQGDFYGVVLTPYYWIVPSKLQAVVQYMYAGSSEDEGIRTNSRYFRATTNDGHVNSGRGNELHTLYTGLNWLICGDNLKFQFGVEYANLSTPQGDRDGDGDTKADALTYLMGFRTNF
jgi:phosphate-selective porin